MSVTDTLLEPAGTTLADAARSILEESDESAKAYLRQSWLSAAMGALWEARRDAGLTQAQVAERMGTTQSAVARMENDQQGRITLHKYIDFVLACDRVPLDVEIVEWKSLCEYA